MRIRELEDADWAQVFPFWRAVVDAGDTYAYPEGLASDAARALWLPGAPDRAVVAVDGDRVLGTAKYGPNRPGRGAHVGTASFIVDPAAGGRGVGRALGEHVLAALREEGYRAVQFNAVVETNTAAVRLWTSLGFRVVGTVPGAFRSASHGYVGLHVMHLELG